MTVYKGIDISKNNRSINFKKVKASGIDFAIIRAGYGRTTDELFKANIKAAITAGIPVGVYWFSYALNKNEAVAEADYCKTLVSEYGVKIPVYYDFEYDTERYAASKNVVYTRALRTVIIKSFCARMKSNGYAVGVYLNPDYIKNRLNYTELDEYPLWLAQWVTETGVTSFAETPPQNVNVSYGTPRLWQIGKGTVPGISKKCDINYYYDDITSCAKPVIITPEAEAVAEFKKNDKVTVINTTVSRGKKRGILYSGGTFVVYNDIYTVLSVNGSRVVIGVGNVVTAAVNAKNLKKI